VLEREAAGGLRFREDVDVDATAAVGDVADVAAAAAADANNVVGCGA